MKKNLLVAQSGGPSSAINATLAGVVEQAAASGKVDKILGARHGIKGVLNDDLAEIGERLKSTQAIIDLVHTPGSALGTCRYKLKSPQDDPGAYQAIFDTLKKHNIGYFIYIGGNDSMDTVKKLTDFAADKNFGISIMGAPKTIDNDLFGMDHSPGYASAARYIKVTFSEIWRDASVYDIPTVTIVETMGRHVGWLCAASALARETGQAPHLIYMPEIPFDDDKFVEDVTRAQAKSPAVVIAISEGIKRADGRYVSEDTKNAKVDAFGHKHMGGACQVLEGILADRIEGIKIRCIDLSLLQRCAAHLASPVDLAESKVLGAISASRALEGVSGEVPVLNRISDDPYRVEYSTVPSSTIANLEKAVPRDWITEDGTFVNEKFIKYVTPLLGEDKIGHWVL